MNNRNEFIDAVMLKRIYDNTITWLQRLSANPQPVATEKRLEDMQRLRTKFYDRTS